MDLKNYNHLKLIPKALMSSNEFVSKVLWTVLKEVGKIHYTMINAEFYKATGFKISDYFEFREDEMR